MSHALLTGPVYFTPTLSKLMIFHWRIDKVRAIPFKNVRGGGEGQWILTHHAREFLIRVDHHGHDFLFHWDYHGYEF